MVDAIILQLNFSISMAAFHLAHFCAEFGLGFERGIFRAGNLLFFLDDLACVRVAFKLEGFVENLFMIF